jgi:hypothetical protein
MPRWGRGVELTSRSKVGHSSWDDVNGLVKELELEESEGGDWMRVVDLDCGETGKRAYRAHYTRLITIWLEKHLPHQKNLVFSFRTFSYFFMLFFLLFCKKV